MVAVAVQEELVRPGVMAVIEDLVEASESGVLEIEGNPSGRIYLEDGRITFARASWVAGLAARLRAIAPSLDDGEIPPSQEADDARAAELVLRHGYLNTAGLHEIIESIVVDAFLVLTIPLVADTPVAGVHFKHALFAPTDLFPRLTLELVRAEAIRRAELMAEYGLGPTTPVAPRDLAASATVLTREQWAVACQIGDRVSARELALRIGASLSETVHCLGSLVSAGLCAPVRGSGHRHAAQSAVPPQPRPRRVPARPAPEPAVPPQPRVPAQSAPEPAVQPQPLRVPAPTAPEPAPPTVPPQLRPRRVPARAALEAAPPAVPPQPRRAPARAASEPAVQPQPRRAPARAALEAAPPAVPPQPRRRVPARAALEAAPPAVPPRPRRAPARAALEPAAPPRLRRAPARAALEAAPSAFPPQARRVPGASLEPAGPHRQIAKYQPPSVDVLQQVLTGLRQLN